MFLAALLLCFLPIGNIIVEQHDQLNQPIHSEQHVHFSKVNQDIWEEYQGTTANKTIQEAPEEAIGREEQGGVGEVRESEGLIRKCSKCNAENPLSAFVPLLAFTKRRYVKMCLECRTKRQ